MGGGLNESEDCIDMGSSSDNEEFLEWAMRKGVTNFRINLPFGTDGDHITNFLRG